jgi:hypothetical protein
MRGEKYIVPKTEELQETQLSKERRSVVSGFGV